MTFSREKSREGEGKNGNETKNNKSCLPIECLIFVPLAFGLSRRKKCWNCIFIFLLCVYVCFTDEKLMTFCWGLSAGATQNQTQSTTHFELKNTKPQKKLLQPKRGNCFCPSFLSFIFFYSFQVPLPEISLTSTSTLVLSSVSSAFSSRVASRLFVSTKAWQICKSGNTREKKNEKHRWKIKQIFWCVCFCLGFFYLFLVVSSILWCKNQHVYMQKSCTHILSTLCREWKVGLVKQSY